MSAMADFMFSLQSYAQVTNVSLQLFHPTASFPRDSTHQCPVSMLLLKYQWPRVHQPQKHPDFIFKMT